MNSKEVKFGAAQVGRLKRLWAEELFKGTSETD